MDQTTKDIILAAISARAEEADLYEAHRLPASDSIQIIYEGTVEGYPARRLLVQLYTNFANSTSLAAEANVVSKDFLCDLSLSMLRSRALLRDHVKMVQQHKSLEIDNKRLNDELRAAHANLRDATTRSSSPSGLFGDFGSSTRPSSPPRSSRLFGGGYARPAPPSGTASQLHTHPFSSIFSANFP